MVAVRFCRNASSINHLSGETSPRTGGATEAEMGGIGLTGGAGAVGGSTGAVGGTTVRDGGGAATFPVDAAGGGGAATFPVEA